MRFVKSDVQQEQMNWMSPNETPQWRMYQVAMMKWSFQTVVSLCDSIQKHLLYRMCLYVYNQGVEQVLADICPTGEFN